MKVMKRFLALALAVMVAVTTVNVQQTEAKERSDYEIRVNVGTNCVTIYQNGKPVKAMICSPSSETPIGTFYTPVKYEWHEMIGNCYAQYCTRITTGILFHSVWYYREYDKSSMSVSAYNVMGNKASHGCVRLLCVDAKWIYDNCALGTKVVIFWGTEKDDPLGRPSFTPIKTGERTSWDPTDPDPANPYKKSKPTIKGKVLHIEYGSKVSELGVADIRDFKGTVLTNKNAVIKTIGKINTKKIGKYSVEYDVTDSWGNRASKKLTFEVVDTKQPKVLGTKTVTGIPMGDTRNVMQGVSAKTVPGKDITKNMTVKVTNVSTKKQLSVKKGKVKFNEPGKYRIAYHAYGSNGRSIVKSVYWTVVDARVRVSMKAKTVKIAKDSKFKPLSYVKSIKTYKGKKLGIKNRNVKVEGKVKVGVPGKYKVKYTFSNGTRKLTRTTKTLTVVVK